MENEELEALISMTETDGWKIYSEDKLKALTSMQAGAVDYADTNDKWQFARGQIIELRQIVGFADYLRAVQDENDK